jgi:hypothetical protein
MKHNFRTKIIETEHNVLNADDVKDALKAHNMLCETMTPPSREHIRNLELISLIDYKLVIRSTQT